MSLTIVICGGITPKPLLAVRDPGIVEQITQLLMQRLMADKDEALIEEVIFGDEYE